MKHSPPLAATLLRMSAALLFTVFGTSCDLEETFNPGGSGLEGPTMMASVVAFDGSAPSLNGLTHIDGTVTLEGVDVELWDGVTWLKVVSQLGTATLVVGAAGTGVTVMPETEIPTADYSRIRLSAALGTAALSMTVDGQHFGTDGVLGLPNYMTPLFCRSFLMRLLDCIRIGQEDILVSIN